MSFPELYSWLANAGFPGVLALSLYLSLTGKIRWDRELQAMIAEKDRQIALITEDRDWWKEFGTRTLDVSEHAIKVTAAAGVRRRT